MKWLVSVFAVIFLCSIAWAAIDVNLHQLRTDNAADTNLDFSAIRYFSYSDDRNVIIDFNVLKGPADGNSILVDINYGTSAGQGSGTVIVNDLNLFAISGQTNPYWCDSTNFNARVICHVDWNISGVSDANYYIKILVDINGEITDFNTSGGNTIRIDNTNPVHGTDYNRNVNSWADLNGFTEKNIGAKVVGDFNGANAPSRDNFVGTDSNLRIGLRLNLSSDVNFTPMDVNVVLKDLNIGFSNSSTGVLKINDRNWMAISASADNNFAMTPDGDGNYHIDVNIGNFDKNFATRYVRFIVKDYAGNQIDTNTAGSDLNLIYPIILYSMTYPSGMETSDLNTTNWQDINRFGRISQALKFTKVKSNGYALGRITLRPATPINLSVAATAAKVASLSSYLQITQTASSDVNFWVDTTNFSDLNVPGDLNAFNLPRYDGNMQIHKIDNSGTDMNCGSVCSSYSYSTSTGDLNVTVSHFTTYITDANVPVITITDPTGGTATNAATSQTITVTTDEQATCRYSTTNTVYADMASTTTSSQGTTHSWTVSTPESQNYGFHVRCRDLMAHTNGTSASVSFSINRGSEGNPGSPGGSSPGGGTPREGNDDTPDEPAPEQTESLPVGAIEANTEKTLALNETSEHGIAQVALTVNSAIPGGRLEITGDANPNTSRSAAASNERVYRVVEITVRNVAMEAIANGTIFFVIPKAWFSENNLDPTTVRLNRLVNGAWMALETRSTQSDATNYYFEAVTPGFSFFAITAAEIPRTYPYQRPRTTTPAQQNPQTPAAPQTTSPRAPDAGVATGETSQQSIWAFVGIAVIILLAAGYYLTQRKKHF